MKKTGVLSVALACLVTSPALALVTSKIADECQDAEQAISKLYEVMDKALVDGDIKTLEPMFVHEYMAVHPDGKIFTGEQEKRDFVSRDVVITVSQTTVMKVGVFGDTAVVIGKSTTMGKTKGHDWGGDYRFTDVWLKRDGSWKCASSQ